MVLRIILGVIIGFLLVAYFPLVIKGLPYILLFAIGGVAFLCLRSAPMLAEPLGYGLLVVLLCYIFYLIKRNKKQVKDIISRKQKMPDLPIINIPSHPQLSALITMILYTLGLTFVLYLAILLIYVQ